MTKEEATLSKNVRVSIEDEPAFERVVEELFEALGGVFSLADCDASLYLANGDVGAAAENLVKGSPSQRSISWNWEALAESCTLLVQRTGLSEDTCLEALKRCMGNAQLAERKLMGLSALP